MNRINFKVKNFKPFIQPEPKPKVVKVKKDNSQYYKPNTEKARGKEPAFHTYEPAIDFTWMNYDITGYKTKPVIKEPKKGEINVRQIQNGSQKYNEKGRNDFHSHNEYTLNNCSVKISDNVGGCGVQQFYAWTKGYSEQDNKKILEYILANLHYGTGIILCQVGMTYFEHPFVKALESVGFKYHEEYINHYHHGEYKGRIYSLIIVKPNRI